MKRLFGTFILSAFVLAASLSALPVAIDGRWTGQLTVNSKGGERTLPVRLDLKTADGMVTGSLKMGKGKRVEPVELGEGRLDGDKLTFTTKVNSRRGERILHWQGLVKDGVIELTRDTGRRGPGRLIVLKRAE